MNEILLAFIPIFVAVDAIGTLPIFISLTQGVDKTVRAKIIFQSMLTAIALAVGFIFLGKIVFHLLGITVPDFMIAGGLLLFAFALVDLVSPGKERMILAQDLGVVPLGKPLIVGPAVLTTSLILIDQYGLIATLGAVILNILLAGIVFSSSDLLNKILGEAGSRAMSKVTTLLLSAIAVMMIRKGLKLMLNI